MTKETARTYAAQIAEPNASPERIEEIARFLSAVVYGQLCSAGNLIFERAQESDWDRR
jgi:hypothetical protein